VESSIKPLSSKKPQEHTQPKFKTDISVGTQIFQFLLQGTHLPTVCDEAGQGLCSSIIAPSRGSTRVQLSPYNAMLRA
jgi:hypothetical protein